MSDQPEDKLEGEIVCPCWKCGKAIAYLTVNDEPNGLAHEPNTITGVLGPNGETGCDAFDDLDGDPETMTNFLRKCREALERKQQARN